MLKSITVQAEWHDAQKIWIATSSDIWGLTAQAPDLERLRAKVLPMIADLVELNKVEVAGRDIPVDIVSTTTHNLHLESVA